MALSKIDTLKICLGSGDDDKPDRAERGALTPRVRFTVGDSVAHATDTG